jgi:hypothetical protein
MTGISPRRIWVEQCEASATIRTRYGRRSAFDYLVVEKLTNFAEAARQHPDFARELPAFLAEVRRLFAPEELCAELERLERESGEADLETRARDHEPEDDEVFREPGAAAIERAARFETIKELLLASQLGIS